MSDASDLPAGSLGSIVGSALLYGCGILMLLLAATMVGWMGSLDAMLTAWLSEVMREEYTRSLPNELIWLVAALLTFATTGLLLGCRFAWQRLTIWLAALVMVALWGPVLCLSSHRPEISIPWFATFASGLLVTTHLYWMTRKASRAS